MKKFTQSKLLEQLEILALEQYNGTYTLFKTEEGYKCLLGSCDYGFRLLMHTTIGYKTMAELLYNVVEDPKMHDAQCLYKIYYEQNYNNY